MPGRDNKKIKILMLGDCQHANAIAWIVGLEKYGNCEVDTISLLEKKDKSRPLRVINWLLSFYKVRKIIRNNNYDVIIGYRLTSYGVLAAASGHKNIVLAAQGETDVWPQNHWTTPIKTILAKYAIKKAKLIHAWGINMSKSILGLGCPPQKLLIMPRGINLEHFTFLPKNIENEIHIVCTRGLGRDYNHDVILNAMKKLDDENVLFTYHILGDGPERLGLEKMAEELQLSKKVNFYGKLPHDKVIDYLHKCHIYISVPITEGTSASLLEAMASGCYPLVTRLPGNQEWITDSENGMLVDVNDSNAIVDAIKYILDNKNKVYEKIYENRIMIEEKASMEKNMNTFAEKYREL